MLGGSDGSGVFGDTVGVGGVSGGVGVCGIGVGSVCGVCGDGVCGVGSDSDAGAVGGGGLSGLIGEYNYLHSFWWHRDSPAHNALLHFFAPSLYIGLHNLHKPCILICISMSGASQYINKCNKLHLNALQQLQFILALGTLQQFGASQQLPHILVAALVAL